MVNTDFDLSFTKVFFPIQLWKLTKNFHLSSGGNFLIILSRNYVNQHFYRFPHCVLRSQVHNLISPQFHNRNKEQIQLTLLGLEILYVIKKHQNQFRKENWWPLSKKTLISVSGSLRVRHHSRLKYSPENITIFTMYLYHYRLLLSSQTVLLAPQGQRQDASLQSDLNILLFITFERNVSRQNTCLAVRWS